MSIDTSKMIRKPLDGITFNGKPLTIFVEEESQRESDKLHKEEVRRASAGTGYTAPATKYGNTSGTHSQHRNLTSDLSPEALVHVNYLHEKGGTKAVNDFLSMPKQENTIIGPIEAALRDAQEKATHYRQTREKAALEEAKWLTVVEQLQGALLITQGKSATTTPRAPRAGRTNEDGTPYNKLPRGFWVEVMGTLLANGRVVSRQTLLDEMRAKAPNTPPDLASAALTRAIAINQVRLNPDRTVQWVAA